MVAGGRWEQERGVAIVASWAGFNLNQIELNPRSS